MTTPLERIAELEAAMEKINTIRNSMIGLQSLNWSEHVYPLVAVLDDAGFEGMEYPEARGKFGTMLERTVAAEDEKARLLAEVARLQHHADAEHGRSNAAVVPREDGSQTERQGDE